MLAVVALGIPLALSLQDRVDAEVRAQALGQAGLVAASVNDALDPPQTAELRRVAEAAARTVRGRVIVVDERGGLLADSAGAARGRSYARRPEIAAALQGRSVQRERRSETLDEDLLVTAVPVIHDGVPAGAVRISQSVAAVERSVQRSWAGLALIAALVLLLGLGAGALIAREVARPLRSLEEAAGRISAGDLEARAPVEGSSEQQALARAFNSMTARLARLLRSQQEFVADASHQLRTPLTGLRLRLENAAAEAEPGRRGELEAAIAELDRMSQTIDELLVLSRAGERDAPSERLELGDVAGIAQRRWSGPAAQKGVTLVLDVPERPLPAHAPRADVERALDVLVENALAYGDGRITIRARDGAIDVLDEGPGLAGEDPEALFSRFHRGRAGRTGPAGTGLGLAISRELARNWGGDAELADRHEGGARATLTFSNPFAGPQLPSRQ